MPDSEGVHQREWSGLVSSGASTRGLHAAIKGWVLLLGTEWFFTVPMVGCLAASQSLPT